ncbi:hypothetical protein C5810_005096 [Salmonella enterica subsp. enterica serovar Monschaui]|nr:hypothetical protein [Salmonella enterica]EDV1680778.1 hypothetical protein [Salmonella enterica subsp. enterica serovar Monschaui]EDX3322166.1 hypothetical protein [Salmonella enterica subsp. enterica serovar Anatum]EJB7764831.1 hypothetical protein [Salmonella enterica]
MSKNYDSHRRAIVSKGIPSELLARITDSDIQVINTFLTRIKKLELTEQQKSWLVDLIEINGNER